MNAKTVKNIALAVGMVILISTVFLIITGAWQDIVNMVLEIIFDLFEVPNATHQHLPASSLNWFSCT